MRVDGGELVRRHARVAHSNARRSWSEREGVVLALRARRLTGVGEGSPLPGYSRDDLARCAAELEGCWERLPEIDPDEDVRATLRQAVAAAGVGSAAAVFALETAVLDLVSRARGRPAWAVLRGSDDARRVPLSALAEGATAEDLAASAERARERGLGVVKIKVGGPDAATRDPPRLEAVRARVGDAMGLRLDANQTLPAGTLASSLARLAAFGPELLEEPTTPEHQGALGASPVRLALDESLMLDGWRERIGAAARLGTYSAVVLKPMALGGFDRCLAMAELAAELGLAVIVTHVFDGPIGTAAAACLALSVRGRVLPCGLDGHGRLEQPVVAIDDTHVVPYDAPGLGVESFG